MFNPFTLFSSWKIGIIIYLLIGSLLSFGVYKITGWRNDAHLLPAIKEQLQLEKLGRTNDKLNFKQSQIPAEVSNDYNKGNSDNLLNTCLNALRNSAPAKCQPVHISETRSGVQPVNSGSTYGLTSGAVAAKNIAHKHCVNELNSAIIWGMEYKKFINNVEGQK